MEWAVANGILDAAGIMLVGLWVAVAIFDLGNLPRESRQEREKWHKDWKSQRDDRLRHAEFHAQIDERHSRLGQRMSNDMSKEPKR